MLRFAPGTEMIRAAAKLLGPLREKVAFVGGASLDLHITDPTAAISRTTDDVDVIVEVVSTSEYQRLEADLRKLGFENDMTSKVICRYRHSGLVLDFMPTDPDILGFGNQWYRAAILDAVGVLLEPGLTVNVITAPYFLATKLDAFESTGREGQGDYFASRDIADVVAVIDGRPEIVLEIAETLPDLRQHLSSKFKDYLERGALIDCITAHLRPDPASQARDIEVLRRMQAIAALATGS